MTSDEISKGTNTLPEDESLPWSFIAPLSLLIIGFLISLAFCIVRIVIRNRSNPVYDFIKTRSNQVTTRSKPDYNQTKRVNFPVVGFAAHAVAAICYFAASVILIYALTADDDNPLFVPKDRKRFIEH